MNTDRALAFMKRCPVWTETHRHDGYIVMEGLAHNGSHVTEVFLEADLTELLKQNVVKCETSQRLANGNPNRIRPGVEEVTNKYWSVVE